MCGTLRFPLKPAAIHVRVFESIPARFPQAWSAEKCRAKVRGTGRGLPKQYLLFEMNFGNLAKVISNRR